MTPRSDHAKTVPAQTNIQQGRLAKAKQFLRVADDAREIYDGENIGDAVVTLYVHAGIAAADAICAAALGKHAKGPDHHNAVALLASVDGLASKSLSVLLGMKTRAGYGHDPISVAKLISAERAARLLVERASL